MNAFLRKTAFNSRFALCIALPFTLMAANADWMSAQTQVNHVVIARTGDAAPAGGNYAHLNTVTLNRRGNAAFDSTLRGTDSSGVFTFDGTTSTAVALGGNSGPFDFVSVPIIDEFNRVLFSDDVAGLLRSEHSTIVPLVLNGDAAPGGGTLFPDLYVADPSGALAFHAFISGDVNSEGIFRGHRPDTTAVVRLDQVPPLGGAFSLFGGFAINQRRQVAYYSVMTGGTADFAIFRKDGEATRTIFAENQKAPGGGLLGDFSDPVMNEFGQVATLGFALQNTDHAFGVFLGDGEKVIAIALSGQAAPRGGNYFLGTFAQNVLNNRGEVGFNVGLSGGSSTSGIFRGDGVHTTTIALQGDPAPGTNGATFAAFNNMKMLDDGRMAFEATLTFGVGDTTPTNNSGIWVGTSEKDLRLVVRAGDIIDGTMVKCIPATPDRFDMSEKGVVWISGCSGRVPDLLVFSSFGEEDNSKKW